MGRSDLTRGDGLRRVGRWSPLYNFGVGLPEWLALAGIVVTALMGWRRFGSVRVSADEVSGPSTVEYGFSQNSVGVVVVNRGGASVGIGDIRLMVGRKVGDLYTELDSTGVIRGFRELRCTAFAYDSQSSPTSTVSGLH